HSMGLSADRLLLLCPKPDSRPEVTEPFLWSLWCDTAPRLWNNLPLSGTVLTPAFTNSVRRYRQAQEHYGSWDLMCGKPPQILANLVMEELHPDLRSVIGPKLKGKLQQRQRSWMLISGAVYRQVLTHTISHYEALVQGHEAQRGPLDAALRTDMDQIINSKEHVSGKIKAVVLPKVEQVLKSSVEPYVSSILDALMVPTSRGFSEVREVFSRELVELSKNSVEQDQDKLGELMERMSMLAFHPVKMHSCYDELERLELEGLQQRFSVSGPRVFSCRAQILLREQMDNAVYTFEQLLNQSLQAPGESDLCKSIQKCQERVLKKFDYDSSTVRKKFFREALLQIIVPYMLQQLAPSCVPELPRFQELIFEDFSRFLLVEDLYEEVIIQSVSKDIMSAVKEAAVQRRHNLYRDSIVLTNSDPNLHLLGEEDQVDWRSNSARGSNSGTKRNQVVSMIQLEGVPLPYESCLEVPGEDLIPEEEDSLSSQEEDVKTPINQIRDLIHPVVELVVPASDQEEVASGTESKTGLVVMEDGIQEEVTHVTTKLDKEAAIKSAIHELEIAVQDEEDSDQNASGPDSDSDLVQPQRLQTTVYSSHNDSGFQSPTNERPESARTRPISNGQVEPADVEVVLFLIGPQPGESHCEDVWTY
uniref:Niban 1/2/3 domain-containing protein n=1 Tax=Periophthalmus magnuspinnatus TaxID=409849 RepID=A0A3B4B0Q3_9GOBI